MLQYDIYMCVHYTDAKKNFLIPATVVECHECVLKPTLSVLCVSGCLFALPPPLQPSFTTMT